MSPICARIPESVFSNSGHLQDVTGMQYLLTFQMDPLFYDSKFSIQLQDFLDKPLYSAPARNGPVLDPYTCFRIL